MSCATAKCAGLATVNVSVVAAIGSVFDDCGLRRRDRLGNARREIGDPGDLKSRPALVLPETNEIGRIDAAPKCIETIRRTENYLFRDR
jgi:hypothetical protein